jgi:hypothetical protein
MRRTLADPRDEVPLRRVREHAMDGLVVVCVSAAISTGMAIALTVIVNLFG